MIESAEQKEIIKSSKRDRRFRRVANVSHPARYSAAVSKTKCIDERAENAPKTTERTAILGGPNI
jgi:hypothetical protein